MKPVPEEFAQAAQALEKKNRATALAEKRRMRELYSALVAALRPYHETVLEGREVTLTEEPKAQIVSLKVPRERFKTEGVILQFRPTSLLFTPASNTAPVRCEYELRRLQYEKDGCGWERRNDSRAVPSYIVTNRYKLAQFLLDEIRKV
jgi:hypothetical protein